MRKDYKCRRCEKEFWYDTDENKPQLDMEAKMAKVNPDGNILFTCDDCWKKYVVN